jgi:integrase
VTRLSQSLADYLRVRRGLGFKLQQASRLLPDFVRYLDKHGHTHVTTTSALAWSMLPRDAQPGWWRQRLVCVRGFAKYLQTIEPRNEVPSLEHVQYTSTRSTPYIYSDVDVAALLGATEILRGAFRAATYKTLFGLLAVTGMRVGEVVALDDHDFDRRRGLLVIRKSKFGKSREVPLHTTVITALERYRRTPTPFVRHRSPSLFVSMAGTRLFYQNVHETFLRLVYAAGLGQRKPRPTIHDLRHSFAVRTVIDWHRAGLDVEARLPLLSTYLGHIGPQSTYWYLTAVPELLEAATARLERFLKVTP